MSERHVDVGALLRGRLRGRTGVEARAHLQRCARCREEHDALLLAERALGGDLELPSVLEREGVLDAVLADVAPPRTGTAALWWGVPALAAAAALVLVLLRPGDGGFVDRSAPGRGQVAMRGFCVVDGQAEQLSVAQPCARGGSLVATATAPESPGMQPSLWLVDAAGELHEGARTGRDAAPPALDEQVIDAFIDLDARVALGPARLLVVWTQDGSARSARHIVSALDRGTPDDAVVVGVDLVIEEAAP